ncbi:MAG: class I SAM-dependent DNA methyltransferase [Halanaerobiaceae bacterium]
MEAKAYTSSFASIYDDIMGVVPYNLWYDYLHEILDYYQLNPQKLLDLACGTGTMSMLYAENDYKVTGIDISEEMLRIAGEKAEKRGLRIDFEKGDLRNFNINKKFDMAYCLFDSLNYILSEDELRSVFENVSNVLKKDGYFIFDMNTIKRLMSIHPGKTVINGDTYSCIWEDIIDKENKRWQVKLKIYLKNLDEYFEEFHQETGYEISIIEKLLKDSGFKYIDVYNAYTFTRANDNDNRVYFVAFLNKENIRKKPVLIKSIKNIKWGFKKLISVK